MEELLDLFLAESRDFLQQASDALLAIERDGPATARLDGAYRAIHTLKGSVALFDFAPMGEALHAAEDLLGALREGRLAAERPVMDPLLQAVGACEAWLEAIARSGRLPEEAEAESRRLTVALRAPLADGEAVAAPPPAPDWLPALLAEEAAAVAAARAAGQGITALRYLPRPDCFFLGDDPMAVLRAVPELIALRLGPREPWPADYVDPFACNLDLRALSTATPEQLRPVFRLVADQVEIVAAEAPAATVPREAEREAGPLSLRVEAARIDALLDILGELLVAKNGLADLAAEATARAPHLAQALQGQHAGIERLVGTLHRAVMGVRMTPLSRSFRRFPRLVRDLAAKLGKEVAFDITGEAVEADAAIIDGLFEPLLHLLRNALDHGLEDRAARLAAGKPPAGRLSLAAAREGERMVITVGDDGAGIDPQRIRRAARERGLLKDAALAALDDDAAVNLVFAPGFSTAAAVTEVSGRGMGMDAVRAAIEALGGRVSLASRPGAGTTVRLVLPRAALITRVMTVRLGEERFGVPIDAVLGTTRVAADCIQPVGGGEAFVLRDRTLPLLRLASLLGLPAPPRAGPHARILLVAAGGQQLGIEVDGFAEPIDVLLRPLGGLLAGMAGVLGAALSGDGRVLLVLDLPELIG